ncbi:hypothetical protein [Salinispora arenicola]|uniref:hypothetical protein n=1 Tax=Salinispora arenicola TaxID=168697 RepID=UPI0003A417DE|nr:hypothetical protein [Salinispora arenicola]
MRQVLDRWWHRRPRHTRRSEMEVSITALAPARYDVSLVDERQAGLSEVRQHVEALSPNGIDEGTGDALDRAIGARVDGWIAAVDTTHLDGQTTVERMIADSAPEETRLRIVREAEEHRLAAMRDAVELSRRQVAGSGPAPGTVGVGRPTEAEPTPHRASNVWLTGVALLLAAAADLAAFHQVISLVMRDEAAYLVWLLVCGFTATALYLAHTAGEGSRDWVERRVRPAAVIALTALGMWLALGVGAFVIRLHPAERSGGGTVEVAGGTTVAVQSDNPSMSAALLFLCLYLSTGLVAAVSTYRMRDPRLSAHAKAQRAYRRAVRRMASMVARHEAARLRLGQLQAEVGRDRESRAIARAARYALRDELSQAARLGMAVRIQDPAATNGLLPGSRPGLAPHPYPTARPEAAHADLAPPVGNRTWRS